MYGIRTLDGRLMKAETWEAVENELRTTDTDATVEDFRATAYELARQWSGIEIAIDGDARDFLYECERAGMLLVIPDVSAAIPDHDRPRETIPRQLHLNDLHDRAEARKARKENRYAASASATDSSR